MKKVIVIVLCTVMALSLAACGGNPNASSASHTATPSQSVETPSSSASNLTQAPSDSPSKSEEPAQGGIGKVQIPNPWMDCKTLDEAEKLAGFSITLPGKMPEGYSQSAFRAIKDSLVEVDYNNGNNKICIRKGTGSDDISGDYNDYKETAKTAIGSLQVTMKGDGGKVNVATWSDGTNVFSITADKGIEKSVVGNMVSNTK